MCYGVNLARRPTRRQCAHYTWLVGFFFTCSLESTRDLQQLVKYYKNVGIPLFAHKQKPEEQHFMGYMYLEGLEVERNYSMARQYFSNLTNPLFNTSYHVFGRGIMAFYGLDEPHNITKGCELISLANTLYASKFIEMNLGMK